MAPSFDEPRRKTEMGISLTTLTANMRGLVLLSLILGASSLCDANTVYNFNVTIGPATAAGDIITDGTLGTLSAGDILDWDITLSDSVNTVVLTGPLSGNGSFFAMSSPSLSATANQLLFNFSTTGDYAYFETGSTILCFSNDFSACGSVLGDESVQIVSGIHLDDLFGVQAIAEASTPEPGCALLVAGGLAGLWLRKRTRSA
jgi:hypothetical protein